MVYPVPYEGLGIPTEGRCLGSLPIQKLARLHGAAIMIGNRAWRHWPDPVAAEVVAAIGCHNSARRYCPDHQLRAMLRARVQLHLARARFLRRAQP